MNELFKLFAEITEHYMDRCQKSGAPPERIAIHAISDAIQERGYVIISEKYFEFLLESITRLSQEVTDDDAPRP